MVQRTRGPHTWENQTVKPGSLLQRGRGIKPLCGNMHQEVQHKNSIVKIGATVERGRARESYWFSNVVASSSLASLRERRPPRFRSREGEAPVWAQTVGVSSLRPLASLGDG